MKQLIVTINEGYKKIYNYVTIDENGNPKLKNRNHSFWIKDIGYLVNEKTPSLLDEYNQITLHLDAYLDNSMEEMKTQRKLAIHYDDQPSKVYEMLINLNIEKITLKIIPFISILSKMIVFNKTLLEKYNKAIEKNTNDFFDYHHQKLEELKNRASNDPLTIKLLNECQEKLIEFKDFKFKN